MFMKNPAMEIPLATYAHRLVMSSQRTLYVCDYECDKVDVFDLDLRISSITSVSPSASIILLGIKADEGAKSSNVLTEAALLSRYRKTKGVRLLSLSFLGFECFSSVRMMLQVKGVVTVAKSSPKSILKLRELLVDIALGNIKSELNESRQLQVHLALSSPPASTRRDV